MQIFDLVLLKLHRNNTDIHTYIVHGNIFIPTYSLCPSSSHKKSKDESDEKFNFKKTEGQGSCEVSLSNAPGKKLSVLGVEAGRREGKNQRRAQGAHGRDAARPGRHPDTFRGYGPQANPAPTRYCVAEHSRKEEHTKSKPSNSYFIYTPEESSETKWHCSSTVKLNGVQNRALKVFTEKQRSFSRTVILRLLKCPEVQRTMWSIQIFCKFSHQIQGRLTTNFSSANICIWIWCNFLMNSPPSR